MAPLSMGKIIMTRSPRLTMADISKAAGALAGRTGKITLSKQGFEHKGALLGTGMETLAGRLMVERNLRNFILGTPLMETQIQEVLSDLISSPVKAINNLKSLQIMLNLPREIEQKLEIELIRFEEHKLFVAKGEEGKLYSIQQVKEGHVRGLGEETIDFMRDNGFTHIFVGAGLFQRRADKMHPGGHLLENELGMEDAQTSDWTRAIPFLDSKKCKACEICVIFCPEGVIDIHGKGKEKQIVIELKNCKGCGICELKCPPKINAISMVDKTGPRGQKLMAQALAEEEAE